MTDDLETIDLDRLRELLDAYAAALEHFRDALDAAPLAWEDFRRRHTGSRVCTLPDDWLYLLNWSLVGAAWEEQEAYRRLQPEWDRALEFWGRVVPSTEALALGVQWGHDACAAIHAPWIEAIKDRSDPLMEDKHLETSPHDARIVETAARLIRSAPWPPKEVDPDPGPDPPRRSILNEERDAAIYRAYHNEPEATVRDIGERHKVSHPRVVQIAEAYAKAHGLPFCPRRPW